MREKVIVARVFRFNPQADRNSKYTVYRVQSDKGISVLNLLNYIHQELDRSLAYRNYSCHLGVCASCLLNINGRNLKGCTKIVTPGDIVTVKPPTGYKIIRDLVVDFGAKTQP